MSETERQSWTGSGATAHHMDEGEFRRFGKEMIDWVADYLYGGVEQHPVQSPVAPGEVRSMLPGRPPGKARVSGTSWRTSIGSCSPG